MKPRIVVIALAGVSPFHLSVPCVVFGEAHPGLPELDFKVCAIAPGRLLTTGGFVIEVVHGLEALKRADTIIVPSWPDPDAAAPPALLDALRRAHRRGARVVGLCLGAYVLAEAGLLDGRRATTHWGYAAHFAARFPAVSVDAGVLYVDEGAIVTSAGTAAGLDCCLHLVRRDHGAEVANSIARRLVVPPHRQGGQAQFVEQPLPVTAGGSRLGPLLDALRGELQAVHSLDSLAARVLMSRRSFTRAFRQQTGMTVMAWLIAERLALAQRLLESTAEPVERIAERCGIGSVSGLREHFQRAYGVSPSRWRASFGRVARDGRQRESSIADSPG